MKSGFIIIMAVLVGMTACSNHKQTSSERVEGKSGVVASDNSAIPEKTSVQPANVVAEQVIEAEEKMESEDDVRAIFMDPFGMTADELKAILHSLEKCKAKNMGDWYNIRDCSANRVFNELASGRAGSRKLAPEIRREVYLNFLKESESAVVRDLVYSQIDVMGSESSVDLNFVESFLEIVRNETDPIALSTAVGNLSTAVGIEKVPSVCDYLFDVAAGHESVLVRRSLAEKMSGSMFKDQEKAKVAVVKLCQDVDPATRNAACGKIIDFEVPNAMELAVSYLNDPDKAGAHGAIISSLNKKWLNPANPDGAAYQVVYNYLLKQPRSEELPAWNGISDLGMSAGWAQKEDESYKAWVKAASFYKPEAFIGVLNNIIMDSNASYLCRFNSIDQVIRFGSVDDLKVLSEGLENRKGNNDVMIFDAINRKIEEITMPKNHDGMVYVSPDGVVFPIPR